MKTLLSIAIILLLIVIVIAVYGAVSFGQKTIIALDENDQVIAELNDELYPALDACRKMKAAVVQVQVWFMDISATRSLDGYNDGFDMAEIWAENFERQRQAILEIHSDEAVRLQEIADAFTPYYETGQTLAQAYIDEGPAGGNLLMGDFDRAAVEINELVDEMLVDFTVEFEEGLATLSRY